MKLLFCGDIMPGGVLPYQTEFVSPELREYLAGFDARIGTLEAAIGTDFPFDPVKVNGRQNIVYAREEDFFRVKDLGFNVVSLANNHMMDLTEQGLSNTIKLIRENGIKSCGAGANVEEASRPAVIEKDGISIAVLAYCMYGNKYLGHVELASKDKAGINPLDINTVMRDIADNKKKYDRVIVMPHWGREYTYYPLRECVAMAKQMINAGADAVLGSHTHQIQPYLKYRGKPICFSMGNFLFPDFYMRPPRPIWYPSREENLDSLKDVVGYPFPIKEPIRQVWNPISRYGCIVALDFEEDRCTTSIKYVHLSESNVVSLCELPSSIRKGVFDARLSIGPCFFRLIRKFSAALHRYL
jgi:Putative enzyme of poly-gamma-glutamate biosynthesis (capsule formation)